MGSMNDTSKNKILFKKRAHRPWQPSLLEGMDADSNVLDATQKIQDKQFQDNNHLEFLQKQLETTLEIKSKEKESLSLSLNTIDDHRVTLGGFLRPKDILMVTEQASLQKSASLISELKEKEQEILNITQHLKISQAEEYAKRAETSRMVEEKARLNAEEKAIFALRQAQATAEQIKISEEKLQGLEHVKITLEHLAVDLEAKLTLAHQELDVLEQKSIADAEQRFRIEQDLRSLAARLKEQQNNNQGLEEQQRNLTQKLETENKARLHHETQLFEAKQQIAELQQLLESTKITYEQTLAAEKESLGILENTIIDLQTKLHYLSADKEALLFAKEQTDEKLNSANHRMAKMQDIIAMERNLRMVFEAKVKETLLLLEKSELQRRTEVEACKLAEEKAKTTFEQAGKAMLQLLHQSPMNG